MAFRPAENGRINGLVRLHYFKDLGPIGQVTGSGAAQSPQQVSTILSADFNLRLSRSLTLDTRYGYRQGRVSLGRDSDTFVSSDAHLAIVRLDYAVMRQRDIMAERRGPWVNRDDSAQLGALGAVYRHVGDEVKVGLGYHGVFVGLRDPLITECEDIEGLEKGEALSCLKRSLTWRAAQALLYAEKNQVPAENVIGFIKQSGGIRALADKS